MQRDSSAFKAMFLWILSLSLSEINTIVSILAGLAALGYSAHKWIDYVREKKRKRKDGDL
jgi:hypothetical protein